MISLFVNNATTKIVRRNINIPRAALSSASPASSLQNARHSSNVCALQRKQPRGENFRAFPLKCLAAALVVAVNSFRALQNEEYGVKRVSCEVRLGENNENKYVPRALNAPVRCSRRAATRYVCYIEIDFAKNENVFRRTHVRRTGGRGCRRLRVDGRARCRPPLSMDTIISFFLAPLPFSAAIASLARNARQESSE